MKKLLNAIEKLLATAQNSQKITILLEYFKKLNSEELNSVLHLLLFSKNYQLIEENELFESFESVNIWDKHILSDSLYITGNQLETISLLLSNNQKNIRPDVIEITQQILKIKGNPTSTPLNFIQSKWNQLESEHLYLFHLIVTGQVNKGIQSRQIFRAIALLFNYSEDWVSQQLSKGWNPTKIHFADILKGKNELAIELGTSYQVNIEYTYNRLFEGECFAYNLEDKTPIFFIIDNNRYFIQYFNKNFQSIDLKQNVIKTQENRSVFLALLTPQNNSREIDQLLHENVLPIEYIERIELIDIINSSETDLSHTNYHERIKLLQSIEISGDSLIQVPTPVFSTEKQIIIPSSHLLDDNYFFQHEKNYSLYAVLTHATLGMGRRETFYSDFTFSIQNDQQLKSIIKLKPTDCKEYLKTIHTHIQKNTLQKFGNLVSVQPELIFEISFTQCTHQKNLSFKNVAIQRQISNLSLPHISKLSNFEVFKSE